MTTAADVASMPLRWREPESVKPLRKLLPVMRAGAAAAPGRSDLQLQFANALFWTGETAEIVERWRPAASDLGSKAELLYLLGRAALAVRDYPLACTALERASAMAFAPALGYLAEALYCLERPDEALDAALRRLATSPADFSAIKVAARLLLARGEPDRLWNLCLDLRARGAWGSWFSTVMVTAAAILGIDDELRTLVDRPRWFSTRRLSGADTLNPGLAAELLALSSTGAEMRVEGLEAIGGPATQRLLAQIRNAVEVYVAERETFANDPMIVRGPKDVSLHAWLITTHDEKHHNWHIHQAGWISGVYYVTVPAVQSGGDDRPGTIEFGPYPFVDGESGLAEHCWRVAPQPGLLILFPSYFAHRSRPTHVSDLRICVPFDVRPAVAAD